MSELKPCPFCGGNVHLDEAYSYFRDFVLYCTGCDMVFTLDSFHTSKEEVIETWNCRTEPEMRPLTLEEVQKHCEEGVGATPLWMEFIGHDDLSRWMVACIPDIVFEAGNIKLHMDAFGHRYNTMWRCWPRKPTPEQMAAEKWEEDKAK